MPYVANTQWRLRADALLTITPTTLYFGVGESTLKPLTYHERNQPGAPQVTNGQYGLQESTFQYQRPGGPEIRLNLEVGFIQEFLLALGLM